MTGFGDCIFCGGDVMEPSIGPIRRPRYLPVLHRIPMYVASIVVQRQLPVVWRGMTVTIPLVSAMPLICLHKNGASQATVLIQHVEGWRRRPSPTTSPSQLGHDADRQALGLSYLTDTPWCPGPGLSYRK
jgi:hypothetical protein